MRKRIYEMVENSGEGAILGNVYDAGMLVVILASLIPLAFKQTNIAFEIIDKVSTVIFIIDYFFRWITADYKYGKCKTTSFLRYPFSAMAIVDLISILPSLTVVNSGFKALRILRLIRTLRVFRVFKVARYSRNLQIIQNVLTKSKDALLTVSSLAIGYILVSALVIINVEPDSFENYFEALYWATVSLTTMGYGDIYPVTVAGRIFTMLSSFVGIAIVALPAGIITAGYMSEIEGQKVDRDSQNT